MESLKKWELLVEANSFDGSQTFACEAVDEEEALAKFKAGLCEIIEVNIEVIGLDENPFDIEESDDITSRLSNDINDRLVEENAALKADRENAISKMSKSWQHNASDHPDLLSRFVSMANRQFEENAELREAIYKINMACISTYGHGVGKMLSASDSESICNLLAKNKQG